MFQKLERYGKNFLLYGTLWEAYYRSTTSIAPKTRISGDFYLILQIFSTMIKIKS